MTPYTDWEGWKAGMYRQCPSEDVERLKSDAIALLSNRLALISAMRDVTLQWHNECEVNLHELPNNRAWLGQAACCISKNVPEDITRQAWGSLTDEQRMEANRAADLVIDEWRNNTCQSLQMELFTNA